MCGNVNEIINIRRVRPFYEENIKKSRTSKNEHESSFSWGESAIGTIASTLVLGHYFDKFEFI